MTTWQTIESAPKDVPILVSVGNGEVFSAINTTVYGVRQWHTNAHLFECFYPQLVSEPTHWMPLPDPPK